MVASNYAGQPPSVRTTSAPALVGSAVHAGWRIVSLPSAGDGLMK